MAFAEVVHDVMRTNFHQPAFEEPTSTTDLTEPEATPRPPSFQLPSTSFPHFKSLPNTPSMRTGPPRSLSYTYPLPSSPVPPRNDSMPENGEIIPDVPQDNGEFHVTFTPRNSDFRGALEHANLEQSDKKGKKRESRLLDGLLDESWNPIRWFHESPKEEKAQFDFGNKGEAQEKAHEAPTEDGEPSVLPKGGIRRTISAPHSPSDKNKPALAKWGRLRSLIPSIVHHPPPTPGPSAVTSHSVNITDELIAGGLSTLMLRLWFERDEKGQRRIPVLFHRLRIRVSDSLHPLHGRKSVFRIECEYANGAARWVIYRQLRDFLSLHAHYALSNAYNRNVGKLPEFPRTSR